jgi:DNA topoisomerase-3
LGIKSKAWNDSKVSAHHAIIPTMKSFDTGRLSAAEANVYELVARQYLIQFYPPFEYGEKQIDTEVAGGLFIAKQKEVIKEGWKVLFPTAKSTSSAKGNRSSMPVSGANQPNETSSNKTINGEQDAFSSAKLPDVKKGEELQCIDAELINKQTSPPKYFTDATLLGAMTGIARYVNDPAIKKVLRETDGLGTEATRAGIIELLFKREFLSRKGKEIRATIIGRQLITSLPESMGYPDMTAHWESQLEAISQRQMNYAQFMQPMTQDLSQLIGEVSNVEFKGLQGLGKSAFGKRKPSGKKKFSPKKK